LSKPDKKDPVPPSIGYGAGHTLVFQSDTSPLPSFSVAWSEGGAGLAEGTVKTGRLVEPKGHLYSNGKESSTYRADTGDADRDAKRLNMDGKVVVQSVDKTQTLRAPHGEYRGDVGIVRATGGVTATGPFGTLSGTPELWATPDLKLIGTPDMVAKTLKIPALVALAATAAIAPGRLQKGNEIEIPKFGPTITKVSPTGQRTTVQPPKGEPLIIRMPSRGLVFRLTTAAVLDLDPKGTQLRHLKTDGPVNVVQTAPDGSQNTLDGTGAEYGSKPGATTGDLDVGGRVTLVSATKNGAATTTTTSKGDQGSAVLLVKPTNGQSALQSATLAGNVTIDSSGSANGTFSGKGDRMVYTPKGDTADVILDGHTILTSVTKDGSDSRTVVGKGARSHAVLLAQPPAGQSPLKSAVLEQNVDIDVSGTNGQKFQGSGDRLVYTVEGEGGRAVMTGDLKFAGDAPGFLGNMVGADTATVTLNKQGLDEIRTSNSGGTPSTSTIKLPPQKPKTVEPKKGKPKANPTKKKGGKS